MKVTKEEFKEWVKKMYTEFLHSNYKKFGDKVTTIVVSKNGNKIGVEKRHKDDRYDCITGVAIAYARATKKKIPEIKDTVWLSELKNGDSFTTKEDQSIKYIFLAVNPLTKNYIVAKMSNSKVFEFYIDMEVYKQ